MIRGVVITGLLVALTHAARSFHPGDGAVYGSGSLLAAGFLLLAALHVGHVFEGLRLPHLTGFLLCGLAFGPQGLDLVSPAMLDDLGLIKNVSIGLIALMAGGALNLRELMPRARLIVGATGAGTVCAFAALCTTMYAALWLLPATTLLPTESKVAIATLGAVALAAASPPVVIGILAEARAAGPLSSAWVPLVVLNNLAVVLSFSLLSPRVASITGAGAGSVVGSLLWSILGSIALGLAVGAVLAVYAVRVRDALGLFVFAVLFVVAEAGAPLRLDPLLVGVAAGLLLENTSPTAGADVARAAAAASLPVFAVFFAVIGAEVHLDVFFRVAPYALVLAASRAVGIIGGTRWAARKAGLPPEQAELLPWGMLPQAGVAIALATTIEHTYEGWGEPVGAMLIGTVVVNELMGPVLFRSVVVSSGEAGRRDVEDPVPVAEVEWADETEPSDLLPVELPR